MTRFLITAFLAVSLAVAVGGPARAQTLPSGFKQSLELWQSRFDDHWDVVFNHITGKARMLLGGQAFLRPAPTDDAGWFDLARDFIDEASGLFEVEASSLQDNRVLTIPLANLGTTDKVTVRFLQVEGVTPLLGKTVNVLFEKATGKLLSIDSLATPNLSLTGTVPIVAANDAQTIATQVFEMSTSGTAEEVSDAELVYLPVGSEPEENYVLVHAVGISGVDQSGHDASYRYYVDAQDGSIVRADDTLLEFAPQQRGVVRARVTDGACISCTPTDCCWLHDCTSPFTPCFTNTNQYQPFMTAVFSTGHTATTDTNGVFARPPGASLNATLRFRGPFVNVTDRIATNNVVVQTTLQSAPNSLKLITMIPTATEGNIAQANGFYRVNQTRDWVRSVNPDDATADSSSATASVPFKVVVNGPAFQGACNANFGSGRIKFFTSDAHCPNGAFATIIWHELGHWLNDRYGVPLIISLPTAAFHEGAADVFSLYQMDFEQLFFRGSDLRSGLNTAQICGDCESQMGCQPSVHTGGLPLMGAFWKMRVNLKNVDPTNGGALANALFLGWQNAFDQNKIHSIIEFQLLVLDDDDGNLADGTPHNNLVVTPQKPIDDAFTAHGFAGYVPSAFNAAQDQVAVRICP